MNRRIDSDRFPEWGPFADAVQRRRPDAGTWCDAWTVRDIVVHQAGNAEELARVLAAHLEGEAIGTRGFDEREGPLRALNDADLWDALLERMAGLGRVAAAADEVPRDTDVAWTGRTMKVPWFAEHMREELVLHGWDITGDDAAARARVRAPGTEDVVLGAEAGTTTIELAEPEGAATLETDPAAHVLLLWGRKPADPSRIRSRVGPETLGRVRCLLSGY
ncbi:maleylpyruvate isomerase N-terminal domain-containing protein [Mycobacterium paraseoulense]|uniref:Mycothiol-dependent maleylpyruvate isomerase metal-binding domain-containing protein n=1 Tax=Mycobacterium paraseoulense TaxID=590652 RepID=A0A1X0IA67_9MYCO|nr:maleylpyruvate isomerase N-terminal domain-containing protein [Mycobacterium paraseoulense]MCV7395080.1 maleylpyruvate isomerase N-terminal domain-containing protein [Mycobacterium paraseoulense]ORB40819.1 hypothetical protein BST39_12940 [Mycobacterium paraseoulense]BBZ71460.1 hypothetical protein MPRS_25530 [Mycobacterium paraseoulense]